MYPFQIALPTESSELIVTKQLSITKFPLNFLNITLPRIYYSYIYSILKQFQFY